MPDHAALYSALTRREATHVGRVWVGVTSTGIFCRLTCPARKPLPENCTFLPSVAACLGAGFRPCKRCNPMTAEAGGDPMALRLIALLRRDPARRWSETQLTAEGIDPSTARRAFQRQFGCSFLEMARQMRLIAGLEALSDGLPVIDAQLAAGFDSPAAFRAAFAGLMGVSPGSFRKDAPLLADWIDTPLGAMIAVADNQALRLLEFVGRRALPAELKRLAAEGGIGLGRPAVVDLAASQLAAFFAGRLAQFTVPLAPAGGDFARLVWAALQEIPAGETRSYSDLAAQIGQPRAVRAVARANASNPIAILIPCHRVIGADGALTGYGGGLWRKQKLIDLETRYGRPR